MIQDPTGFALSVTLAAIVALISIVLYAITYDHFLPLSWGSHTPLRNIHTTEMMRGRVIASLPFLVIYHYHGTTHLYWPRSVEAGTLWENGVLEFPSDIALVRHNGWTEMVVRRPEQAHLSE